MKRLTKRTGMRTYLTSESSVCWAGVPIAKRAFCVDCPDKINRDRTNCGPLRMIDKLAAYEDTGLEPEEVAGLAQMQSEGRLVVLPCKVGDTIYEVWYAPCRYGETTPSSDGCDGCLDECDIRKEVFEVKVPNIQFIIEHFFGNRFCDIYFLSREEAEKALKGARK